MIDYEKNEVQSVDCDSCKCKECKQNEKCVNSCKWCMKKGFTNTTWNRKKECVKETWETQWANRILQALENGRAPITWSEIDRDELVRTIARELKWMDIE